VILTD